MKSPILSQILNQPLLAHKVLRCQFKLRYKRRQEEGNSQGEHCQQKDEMGERALQKGNCKDEDTQPSNYLNKALKGNTASKKMKWEREHCRRGTTRTRTPSLPTTLTKPNTAYKPMHNELDAVVRQTNKGILNKFMLCKLLNIPESEKHCCNSAIVQNKRLSIAIRCSIFPLGFSRVNELFSIRVVCVIRLDAILCVNMLFEFSMNAQHRASLNSPFNVLLVSTYNESTCGSNDNCLVAIRNRNHYS